MNLPTAAKRTLADMKRQMIAEQDAIVDKGRRAYHFGIEENNCPETIPSARALWVEGWRLAKTNFEATFSPRGRQL